MLSFRNFLLEGQFLLMENARLNFIKKQHPKIDFRHDSGMGAHLGANLMSGYKLNQVIFKHHHEAYPQAKPPDHSNPSDLDAWEKEAAGHIVNLIHQTDPSRKGIYTDWLVRQYKQKNWRWEDRGRVRENLQDFETYKPRLKADGEPTDINAYPHPADVEAITRRYKNLGLEGSNKKELERIKREGVKVHHDKNGVRVEELLTKEASCALHGHDTRWCTASHNNNMFDHYDAKGPLFVVHTPDKKKYQFHFESGQFMDSGDRAIHIHELVAAHPELKNVKVFKKDRPDSFDFFTDQEKEAALDRWASTSDEKKLYHVALLGKVQHHRKLIKSLGNNLMAYPLVAKELAIHTDDKDILQRIAKSFMRTGTDSDIARYRLEKMHPAWDTERGKLPSQKYQMYSSEPGSVEHLADIQNAYIHHNFQFRYPGSSESRFGSNKPFITQSDLSNWHQEKVNALEKEFRDHFPKMRIRDLGSHSLDTLKDQYERAKKD